MKQFLISVAFVVFVLAIIGWELEEKTTYSKESEQFITSSYVKVFNRWDLSPYRIEQIDRAEYVKAKLRAGELGSQISDNTELLDVRDGKVINKNYDGKNPYEIVVDNAITNPRLKSVD